MAFLCIPSAAVTLLLGSGLDTSAAVALGRVTGAALLALGVACFLTRHDGSRAATGVVGAMTLYNFAAVVILTGAGIASGLVGVGVALWPAVVLHAVMAIWCTTLLLRKPNLNTKLNEGCYELERDQTHRIHYTRGVPVLLRSELESAHVAVVRLSMHHPKGEAAMAERTSLVSRPVLFVPCGILLLIVVSSNVFLESTGLGVKELGATSAQTQSAPVTASSPDDPPPPSHNQELPLDFKRHTDDLDAMVKRQEIRALVILNPIGFFYDNGLPKGAMYETLQAFEGFTNNKLKTGAIKVQVTFLPFRIDQIEAALTEGIGDIVAYMVAITPTREQRVAFSTPVQKDVTQIILTGSEYSAVSTFEDLGGKEVYVNPLLFITETCRK